MAPCESIKRILIFSLAWSVWPGPVRAQSDANPGKTRALQLSDQLTGIYNLRDPKPEVWKGVCAQVDGYQKEFGVTPASNNNIALLRKYQLTIARRFADPAPYRALLEQLASDPVPAVAAMAKEQLAVEKKVDEFRVKTRPMELQFTAVDGSAVDLARLRGKVVLIDFWASWNPDSLRQVRSLAELYKKYRDKGLAVIGVSLDKDQAAMLAYCREQGLLWPQYFDGKVWETEVSKNLGIGTIPALWLVDKNGMLVSTKAAENLPGEVERLLAESK